MKRFINEQPIQKEKDTGYSKIQKRLGWKLMASYLIVIFIGVITMALAVEFIVPTAFNRHMSGMEKMMKGMRMNTPQLETDLFINFRTAVTEALIFSAVAALTSAVLVSFFVSRRVVIPIRQMMQASRYIAAGHYRERVEVTSNDELGQLAHSFNQMATTLQQTEAMRRDLIANVAHELRTPLTSIKGYMEGLIDGVLPAQADTYQQVYREADRLQHLVNDLQELSRIEARAFKLDLQPLNIATLIKQTADRLRPQFQDKGITLTLKLPASNKLPPVIADENRLNQILINLAGNALQYTPAGGTVIITTKFQDEREPVNLITVKDTGIGIATEDIPHLFTRFYRADKSRSRPGGGNGIGLTIAKYLVEAHGGHIWAMSDGQGQGSIFSFTVPTH